MDADSTTRFVPEHRRTNFKNRGAFKADELRRRREEAQIEIRKQKRDENLSKRRNLNTISNVSDSEDELADELEKDQADRSVCIFFLLPSFLFPLCRIARNELIILILGFDLIATC